MSGKMTGRALLLLSIAGQCFAGELVQANTEADKREISEEERCAINDLWELFKASCASNNLLERNFCDSLAPQPLPPDGLRAELEIALIFMEGWNDWDWSRSVGPYSNPGQRSSSGRVGIPGGFFP